MTPFPISLGLSMTNAWSQVYLWSNSSKQKNQIEFVATCLHWVLCLVASPGLWDLQVDLDLAENVDLLLYFKILHRNKETAWTNKYMDVISKDEPFRCESVSFFEQLGRKLIFFFLHKRSIFCSFPNFSWKFNIHSFHRLKWAMNRLFIFNIDWVTSFLRLWSKHFLPDFNWMDVKLQLNVSWHHFRFHLVYQWQMPGLKFIFGAILQDYQVTVDALSHVHIWNS